MDFPLVYVLDLELKNTRVFIKMLEKMQVLKKPVLILAKHVATEPLS
jgi:hypothetical protein